MIYGYIYKTTNLINGRIYIGQKKSKTFNPKYLGSGIAIKNAVKKYGKENFFSVWLAWCYDQRDLDASEIYHIGSYENKKNMYNISEGGGGFSGSHGTRPKRGPMPQETKDKISAANKGRKHSRIAIENLKRAHSTPECREKLRKQNLGRKRSEEHNRIMKEYWTGKTHKEETRRKMSEARSKYWQLKKSIGIKENV